MREKSLSRINQTYGQNIQLEDRKQQIEVISFGLMLAGYIQIES